MLQHDAGSTEPYTIGRLTRKRSDGTSYWSYCIIWHTDDGRKRVSLGTTDKNAAPAVARELWAKLTLGTADTVGEIVDAYLASLPMPFDGWRALGATDPVRLSKIKGAERKREGWKQAKPFWKDVRLSQIDPQLSADYVTWRKRAANTMRHELGPIAEAMRWAHGKQMIASIPAIKLPAIPESTVDHLTKAQFRKFLDGTGLPHVTLFSILAITTGARATALLQLRWSQIDFDRGIVRLRPDNIEERALKTRATVPLNDRAMEALREAQPGALSDFVIEHKGKPIASIKKGIEAASKRSGVHAHPHMFRHSAAVWMAEDRTPMEEIAAFLGHKNVAITIRVYARYHPDYLRRAARSLDW